MGLRDTVAKRRKERDRPKTLAELRARKQANMIVPEERDNSLAAIRARKLAAASAKRDFTISGLRYHNVVQENGYWKIDVSNNDITYTLHNRFGAWLHSVPEREGYMKEPAWVARALGTSISQLDMARNLIARVEIEMKARGILTRDEIMRQREEEAKANRRKKRRKNDNNDDEANE